MAFISEIHYLDGISLNGGPSEFLEITLTSAEAANASDFIVSLYQEDGSLAAEISLDSVTSLPHPTSPNFVIFTVGVSDVPPALVQFGASFITGPSNANGPVEAIALTDTGPGGGVISFIEIDGSPGLSDITAVGGQADGLVTTTIPAASGGTSIQFDVFGNRVDAAPTINDSIVCFGRDTQIETTQGLKAVQDLRPSHVWPKDCDHIVTSSGEARELRWIGRTVIGAKALAENVKLRPIRITAGALGCGVPRQDLLVSRQHRMLVRSKIAQRMFGETEVLVPAIRLIALPGVFIDDTVREIEYFHILLDSHDIVFANDAPSESLFLGATARDTLCKEHINQIAAMFPEAFAEDLNPGPAVLIPENHQQKISYCAPHQELQTHSGRRDTEISTA